MEYCKHVSTPIITGCKLSKDDESLELDHTMYRSMIVNLLYVTATRPDVMQVVGVVARFQYKPKETHENVVKRTFRYPKGTMDFGLWYPKGKDFTFTAYTNVDWEASIDDRKNSSGGAFS